MVFSISRRVLSASTEGASGGSPNGSGGKSRDRRDGRDSFVDTDDAARRTPAVNALSTLDPLSTGAPSQLAFAPIATPHFRGMSGQSHTLPAQTPRVRRASGPRPTGEPVTGGRSRQLSARTYSFVDTITLNFALRATWRVGPTTLDSVLR
jgi:hypothetical protein